MLLLLTNNQCLVLYNVHVYLYLRKGIIRAIHTNIQLEHMLDDWIVSSLLNATASAQVDVLKVHTGAA